MNTLQLVELLAQLFLVYEQVISNPQIMGQSHMRTVVVLEYLPTFVRTKSPRHVSKYTIGGAYGNGSNMPKKGGLTMKICRVQNVDPFDTHVSSIQNPHPLYWSWVMIIPNKLGSLLQVQSPTIANQL